MATTATTTSCHQLCRTIACPPWLQAALADIEQRVQALAVSLPDEEESHSFAERAENYYQKRPQLLALLQDLHNRYLYLADRYSQSLLKPLHRRKISSVHSDFDYDDDLRASDPDSASSDAESSLSFQPLRPVPAPVLTEDSPSAEGALDVIVAELVVAAVERDLLAAEAAEVERRWSESARKIELQGSLLEVLESERMVLLGENARLGFRAAAAEEEGRAVAAELGYMRRKAAELARLVVKLREDHRVCLLGRKIEALQGQIFGLERRSRECLEAMAKREKEKGDVRFELDRLREENRRLREEAEAVRAKRRRRKKKKDGGFGKWWDRVWKIEWAPCAPHVKGGKGCFYL
ncbi:kinase-interacting family protein-like [Phoenix dactylifera]|uniref:Kinase-interacting family protein-like n=1 Tax=Phoenix dactylifera TaxID=42345 RepID=A0A8B8ZRW5_PHODC|nr:kinase-interacting family protein-like [Phoenix dactylifera]